MDDRSEYHQGTIFDNVRKENSKMGIRPDFRLHELKTDPEPYNDIADGYRSCTVRVDDREYNEGDYLVLRKTKYTGEQMAEGGKGPKIGQYPLVYTGSSLMCKITYIHSGFGMQSGHVVISFKIIDRFPGVVKQ